MIIEWENVQLAEMSCGGTRLRANAEWCGRQTGGPFAG
jgi:hypothetical protein